MGITGAWALKTRQTYTGAAKWGDGIHPIHSTRDAGRGRVLNSKLNPLPLGPPADAVAEGLTGDDVDWLGVDPDAVTEVGHAAEMFAYQDNFPDWNETTPQFRDSTANAVMGEQPSWGVYFDANPIDGFPLPGPTGGTQGWLDVDHGELIEQQRAIAVPTAPVAGGWLTKVTSGRYASSDSAQQVTDPGYQLAIGASWNQGQGVNELDNSRALARGTDVPRSAIRSRTAAQLVHAYANSFRNGGGPGAPDMFPQQQTTGLRRPFFTRAPALPRAEAHQYNSAEGRVPILRSVPPDPFQGDPEDLLGAGEDGGWF